ncbi:MAG: NnrS family protein, partial [Gammaproteobacteria bacterium]
LELSFPVLLFFLFAREVLSAQNKRNYLLVVLVGLFPLMDLAYLLSIGNTFAPTLSWAIYFLPHFVVLLITIIGGRITPAFTGNWLRANNATRLPRTRPWLDMTALAATVAVGLADSLLPLSTVTGVLALVTAFVHGFRLSGWCGLATLSEPLLFVLHVGYGWIVVGYLMLAGASFFETLPSSSAFHAITVGAIGTMILAVMSRVSLGHTGRKLRASTLTVVCYVAVTVAALARIAAPLSGNGYALLIDLSAVAWTAAFTGFLAAYWGILTTPRTN